MSASELSDGGYWSLIEPIWLELNELWDDESAFLARYRQLAPELGHLYAANWGQSEVCNGGFRQFFGNTTGLMAPEAVAGFEKIGLSHLSYVLREAMTCFGGVYPRLRDEREQILAAGGDEIHERL